MAAAPVAPPPAAHPAYLHALSDLRAARAYLARPANTVVKWDENVAIREIDAAIAEIKRAAIDDGKPLEDHPTVDVSLAWGGRLQKALELVQTARRDVNQEEDNAFAQGLKARAVHHIDDTERFINDGIADANAMASARQAPPPPPPQEAAHPAYLHALSDLRNARAMLERPAKPDVKWDESKAIKEIDAAIKEIKDASIDDNKPLSDHPAVDTSVSHRDRLRAAMELLSKSAKDIEEREDNAWSKGLRNRAVNHIRGAERAVHEAIGDRAADKAPPPPPQNDHPAYLHALSDMRMARALLAKPAKADVKWDENRAIREIDAAIKEIKDASIDDGKPLTDHPAIDTGLAHRDRLKNAMQLLHASAEDMEKREDNGWAKGLRNRAVGHVRAAEQAIRDAVEDRKSK
nr:hypothetical protein [Kofleriaceae bacterium]